LVSIINSKAKS